MRSHKFHVGEAVRVWEGDNFENATEYDGAKATVLEVVPDGDDSGKVRVRIEFQNGVGVLAVVYPCKLVRESDAHEMLLLKHYLEMLWCRQSALQDMIEVVNRLSCPSEELQAEMKDMLLPWEVSLF